ncbi:hypothetical protein SOP93_17635 [Peribacillus frigoritolerans]|uniref:hypothetical protein n=1 Tax=Peribacillus frigoritolerans TaxID=450367 RepID=UPI002B247141|nr:hypothetical protein [Peribacillus frigoritolerans]MEB2492979.1 hypothetical protein [Peribacillus frigoritolerans]
MSDESCKVLTNGFSRLEAKVDKTEVTVKADKTYVDTKVADWQSGSPKGTYACGIRNSLSNREYKSFGCSRW